MLPAAGDEGDTRPHPLSGRAGETLTRAFKKGDRASRDRGREEERMGRHPSSFCAEDERVRRRVGALGNGAPASPSQK